MNSLMEYLTKINEPWHTIHPDAQSLLEMAVREGLEVQRCVGFGAWVKMDGGIFDPYEIYRLKPDTDTEPKPEEQTLENHHIMLAGPDGTQIFHTSGPGKATVVYRDTKVSMFTWESD